MLCYKDMTFCGSDIHSTASDCINDKCYRFFTTYDHEAAIQWWRGDQYPVAFGDFRKGCEEYKSPKSNG